jgi:hypothetical protein
VTKRRARPRANRTKTGKAGRTVAPRPVTAAELRALRSELERRLQPKVVRAGRVSRAPRTRRARRPALHWNPEPEDVQKSVAQLVLTLVEFLRRLMERQAIRRMQQKTLTPKEVEAVGVGLMKLEETIREIGKRFGLTPEDLNLDLGTLKLI